ncbi:MAG: polysaccharide pyruvyl transferase family protein [Bacteroides sp.]|nr:polysaccharide pyruvyl transferase family protein [Alistipes timonensis]MCM1311179.1 polysaccharide pyruvyl transferase family protein [Bacteroides sp.]MCM1405576.1 polysaccharide pyruvyl transferase family protein [[Clostridium] fimetarium]
MSRIRNIIQKFSFLLGNLINELRGGIVVNSYAWMNYDGTIDHSNWGDDINYYFLREIIDSPFVTYYHSFWAKHLNRPNYIVIGSTIDLIADEKSVIWGAGIIDSQTAILPKFKEIRAVRGPLTRNKLLGMGYDCPEVFGDPALLIPLHYKPAIKKKYRLGIIPHFHDLPKVRTLFENQTDIKLIDIRNYNDWHDFIDEILECEAIASSSLHGLIMAYAYDIQNVWVEFQQGVRRDRFKYDDFFASIGKSENPLLISDASDINLIFNYLSTWQRGYIDIAPLIKASPFPIKL